MKRIVILASGSGSNAEQICQHFRQGKAVSIEWIGTNNPEAGVIHRAQRLGVPCRIFTREEFMDPEGVLGQLKSSEIDLLVLAGFLWLVPPAIVNTFPGRILNIHPSLLPDFGGKGFYGDNVHKAVLQAGSIMSGITIHQVNERFDEGNIVFQAACHVDAGDTVHTLAAKVHQLEHRFFPVVIEKYLESIASA